MRGLREGGRDGIGGRRQHLRSALVVGEVAVSVALLIAWALGKREAGVVLLAIPVTLGLTLSTFSLFLVIFGVAAMVFRWPSLN